MLWVKSWWQCKDSLLHSFREKYRQQNIKHHHEWQRDHPEDGKTYYGNDEENPPDFVAFPFRRLHLEREETQVADHQDGEKESDAEAGPITQRAVGEVPYLAECQRQRGDEDGHARRGDAAKRGCLCVVDIELG